MISDGELYSMQQDAINRARQTAKRALPETPKKEKKFRIPLNLNDNAIILGVILLLTTDGCNDELLLILLLFLLLKN